jgi:DNA-binding CsgD family transcriptional regulator
MNTESFHQMTARLAQASTLEELTALCREFTQTLGFENFVYALRVPTHFADARVISLDGYPPGWVAHYFEQAYYEVDPVMAYCAKHVVPVRWSDLPTEAGSRADVMMRDAAAHGLREGVTMPVHSPHGELGIFSLSLDLAPKDAYEITERALPWVHVLAGHLQEAVRRVSELSKETSRQLSPREVECLRWAADGKTSAEIGIVAGMAEGTVNYHLNNAMQKLGVSNRQQAVAKAALRGLVQPKPF